MRSRSATTIGHAVDMPETIPFVDLRAQHSALREEILSAVAGVIDTTAFVLGPDVTAFESEFAAYVGARHCIGVESGTAALSLALRAMGIGPHDEVIVPANTYIASALAVSQTGATPVLVDMDERYLIDVDAIEAAITAKTKAIMPVHLYGKAVDMDRIASLARAHGLRIIEDTAQAHGAMLGERRAGSIGDVGCFSFYPGKNLGACGDGGAIVTSDEEIGDAIRLHRDFGQRRKYEHLIKGDNCRLDTMQAAILRIKLRHIDRWNAQRRRAANYYDERLVPMGIRRAPTGAPEGHVHHLYVIEVSQRELARESLGAAGVQTGIHYPTPIHLQPAYAELGLGPGNFPRTEAAAPKLLSLPMFAEISTAQQDVVLAAVQAHVERAGELLGAR